jgi:hypothetical protein
LCRRWCTCWPCNLSIACLAINLINVPAHAGLLLAMQSIYFPPRAGLLLDVEEDDPNRRSYRGQKRQGDNLMPAELCR